MITFSEQVRTHLFKGSHLYLCSPAFGLKCRGIISIFKFTIGIVSLINKEFPKFWVRVIEQVSAAIFALWMENEKIKINEKNSEFAIK
jgi:hypothetical protein